MRNQPRQERSSRQAELPFTGPLSFFKAPYHPFWESWEADVGLLGIPYDFGVGFRPGARFAPNALREASSRYALGPEGYYDWEAEQFRLVNVRIVDAGDVDPAQLEYQESFRRITEAVRELRRKVRLPVFVGGDHSVTYPILRAYDDLPELFVLQLDAHLDFSESRNSTRYSNSSPFRRAVEMLPFLRNITVIGLRGLRTNPEAYRAARERGHTLISARQVREDVEGVLEALPRDRNLYVSLDIDVLDPSVAPGTGSPELDGLHYSEVTRILQAAIQRNRLVGADLVELAPNLDPSGLTALTGARLLADILIYWWG
ncbi:MAG: agmatinase [Armatimonadota bacterium]|nr:agmatinase [Armatimonadota bacterium]